MSPVSVTPLPKSMVYKDPHDCSVYHVNITPEPIYVVHGAANNIHVGVSNIHTSEHPSPEATPPSSHCSLPFTVPSPQSIGFSALHDATDPLYGQTHVHVHHDGVSVNAATVPAAHNSASDGGVLNTVSLADPHTHGRVSG